MVARSGWSKQGGFEIYLQDGARGNELWDRIWEAGQPFGIGPGAPNLIERVESRLLSYGSDATIERGMQALARDFDPITDMRASAEYRLHAAQNLLRRLYLESRGAIVEVACWTHCRRYWWKARQHDPPRAHHVLAVIAQLYQIEQAAKDKSSTDRQTLRAQHAAPLLSDLA